jgi:hypothetical protein
MVLMTRRAPSSRVVLLEDRRGGSDLPPGAPLRRFRLARLRLDGAPVSGDRRYEYLKHGHD